MKLRGYVVALLIACASAPLAVAQSGQSNLSASPTNEQYIPRLGDIMNAVQTRHIKLWFAGKARNWDLAAYELRQLKAGLLEAAVLYEGIPVEQRHDDDKAGPVDFRCHRRQGLQAASPKRSAN